MKPRRAVASTVSVTDRSERAHATRAWGASCHVARQAYWPLKTARRGSARLDPVDSPDLHGRWTHGTWIQPDEDRRAPITDSQERMRQRPARSTSRSRSSPLGSCRPRARSNSGAARASTRSASRRGASSRSSSSSPHLHKTGDSVTEGQVSIAISVDVTRGVRPTQSAEGVSSDRCRIKPTQPEFDG